MTTLSGPSEETKYETVNIPLAPFKFAVTANTLMFSTYRPEEIFKHVIEKL